MKKIKKLFVLAMAPLLLAGCGPTTGDTKDETCTHDFDEWEVEVLPTMSTTGTASRACGLCDDVEELTLPVLSDSSYQKGTDSATCQAAGQQEYTFTHEGKEIKFNVNTAKTGHVYVHHDATALSEQVINGNDEYYTCSMCSTLFDKNKQVIESLDEIAIHYYEADATGHWHGDKASLVAHTYGDPVVDKEATYFEKGEQHKVCSVCGYSATEDIDLLSIGTLNSDVKELGYAAIQNPTTTGANKLVDGIVALGGEGSALDFGSSKINLTGLPTRDGNVIIFQLGAAAKITISGGSTNTSKVKFGFFDGLPNENADNFLGEPAESSSASNADFVFNLPAAGRYYFGAGIDKKTKITSISVEFHTLDNQTWRKDESGHWHSGAEGCMMREDFAAHTFGDWEEVDAENDKRACSECGYEVTEAKALHVGCEHTYTAGVSQNSGKILYTCSKCSDTYEKDYQVFLPNNGAFALANEVDGVAIAVSSKKTPSTVTETTPIEYTMATGEKQSFTEGITYDGQANTANAIVVNASAACKVRILFKIKGDAAPRYLLNSETTHVKIYTEKPPVGFTDAFEMDLTANDVLKFGGSSSGSSIAVFAVEVIY